MDIKTADGTEHTIKVAGNATVHGAKDGFDGLKEGSEVVARCTVKGTEKTADDLGKIGKDGMKVTKGTITEVDTGTKTVVVKSADGTEKTVEYTGNAKDMGRSGRQRYGEGHQGDRVLHGRNGEEDRSFLCMRKENDYVNEQMRKTALGTHKIDSSRLYALVCRASTQGLRPGQ